MQTRFTGLRSGSWRIYPLCVALVAGLLVFFAPGGDFAASGAGVLPDQDELSYQDHINDGFALLRRKRHEEALKSFKKANQMRDGRSAEALIGMAEAYQGLLAYKNVAETCDKVISFASDNQLLQARAYNLKGIALQMQSEGKDAKKLQEAESLFRLGLELNPNLPSLHYNLGVTLLLLGRDGEGVAELKEYVAMQPKDATASDARKMIENPRRAREPYAPEFSITTLQGEYLTIEDLRGKVVLLDFWGTWCGPCVASVPGLRNLYKKYEKEESFVMIGVSSDSDKEKWSSFVAQNRMGWAQYLDRDRRVQRAFEITAFPTYVLIDHEGIIRYRSSGAGPAKEDSLQDAIRKQLKVVAKGAPAN
jgi:thiol-disulfide isomerase/thioredoxin